MSYGKSKYLAKRTQSDKVLWDKVFKIASDSNCDGYQKGLASMVWKLIKNQDEVMLLTSQINNLQMNFIGRLLENSREEKFIHLLEAIFGVLI